MEHDKSFECSEKKETDNGTIASKVYNAQNVIKNKYKKARMDRIEREHDSLRSIEPIKANSNTVASHLSNDLASKQINFSLPRQSKQSTSVQTNENVVNKLCVRLQLLLATPFASSDNHTREMNSILNELRALDIIV